MLIRILRDPFLGHRGQVWLSRFGETGTPETRRARVARVVLILARMVRQSEFFSCII